MTYPIDFEKGAVILVISVIAFYVLCYGLLYINHRIRLWRNKKRREVYCDTIELIHLATLDKKTIEKMWLNILTKIRNTKE